MKPRPIRSRDQLAGILKPFAPSRACERMLEYDNYEVLGGFAAPGTLPENCTDFATRVWSDNGREWYLWLKYDREAYKMSVRHGGPPDWSRWMGINVPISGVWDLVSGDTPNQYVGKYHSAIRENNRAAKAD